jgi:aminoglycoside 6-adenylyltransferase
MRTEEQMLALILGVAYKDERIRAVAMNGSRVNPNAPRDLFQDYDVVFLVTDVASFTADHSWVDVFGERIIMQLPDDSALFPSARKDRFGYLMQFLDGNRIDLTLVPVAEADVYVREDSLTAVLLDKDSCLMPLPPPSDRDYHIVQPTSAQFESCCNEFWWVTPYIAKGLWRGEITYALSHLDCFVRPMLMKMLTWQAGVRSGFAASCGKFGKYLDHNLPPEDWQAFLDTYASAGIERIWQALFIACSLFGKSGRLVAAHFNFAYPEQDDARATAFLLKIRRIPPDAKSF